MAAGLTVAVPPSPTAQAVGVVTVEPVAWGSRLTGTKAYGAWGSPVAGTSALSSSSPSGGGTLGVREDSAGPLTKLRAMVAFGGGTVEAFAEGGAVSGKIGHMLALVRTGTGDHEVWGWGYNTSGQLGNGALVSTNAPVKASWTPRSGEVVEQLAVGLTHSLMLTRQGATRRVYAWGANTYGQLGIAALSMASTTRQTTPRLIDTLTAENIVSIAAGHSHSAAAAADGSVWVWGWDAGTTSTSYGNLGVSGTTSRPVPVRMTNDTVNVRRATPTTYSITSNVLTVNTSDRHFFDVGDTVVQSLGDPELDGSRAITKVTATSYSVTAQPNVTSTATTGAFTAVLPTATPSAASITNNVATVVLSGVHDLRVGNVVDVAVGDPAYDGRRTITARAANSISFTSQPNVTSTPLGSPGTVSFANVDAVTVSAKSLTTNVVTLTVPTGHPFVAQNVVTVDIGDPTFDGTVTLSAVTATTIRYVRSASNVGSTPVVSGTVTLDAPTVSVTNLAITTNTAALTADAAGPAHNFRTGNLVVVSGLGGNLDGPKTITAYNIASRTLSLQAQPNVASTPVTGTVAMARDSDVISAYSIASNVVTVTITSGHDFEVGNQILVTGVAGNLGGPKTITAVAAGTVSYAMRPNQTATAATGSPSAVVTDCSVACPVAPTNVVEVAAGGAYTLARTSAGQVISWGYVNTNNYGRIGRTTTHTPLAVNLPAGCVAVQIAAGTSSSGAVCANGSIATWGYNGLSNLGTNVAQTTAFVAAPALVSGLTRAVGETIVDLDIDVAGMTVLTSTGAVWTWGAGTHDRLGKTGVTANRTTAQLADRVNPPGSPTSSALFSMNYTSGVADTTGVVWTWGFGGYGLHGRGTNDPTRVRFDRIGIDPSTRIALWDTTYYASVMVMSDGSMWTWGSNGGSTTTYFLGDETTAGRLTPGKIDLPVGIDTSLAAHTVTGLDCSYQHCVFTTSNGSVYGWGEAASRQLAVNSTTDIKAPALSTALIKSGLVNPRAAAGNGYSLYVDIGASGTGGRLYAWGSNANRRAAPNSSSSSLTAFTEVKDMSVPASPGTVTDVIAVSAGSTHTVALRADGTIMTWGVNTSGQLGAGHALSTPYYHEPTLSAGATAADLHAEGDHVLIRATDGRLFGWGRNTNGVLGSGATTNLLVPTHVATAHRFARVDTSGHPTVSQVQSTVGLTLDGQVLAWGSNVYGQLGRPDRPNASSGVNAFSSTPVAVLTSTSTPVTGVDVVVAGSWWSAGYHLYQAPLPPSAPQSLAVTSPAPRTLHLTWTAPAQPRDLLGYEIIVSRAGVEVFTAGAAAATTSATLTAPEVDVVDGAAHDVVIRAVNAVGRSDPAGPASATPIGPPSAATSVSASPTPGGFELTFDAPLDTGGSVVLDATVVATPVAGGVAVTTTSAWGPTPLTTTLTSADGLVLGEEYEIAVTLRNVVGSGPTVTSNVVIPGRPGPPRTVSGAGRVGAAQVTWAAPLVDGGLPVLSYMVTAYAAGTRTSVSAVVVDASLFEATVSGLSDGVSYDVDVRASQAADGLSGLGARSATVSVMAGRPVAPASVDVTRTAPGTLTVEWPDVADVPGIAVTGYQVRLDDGTSVSTTSVSCATPTCTSVRSGLVNGRQYRVQVRAESAAGAGPWTLAVTRKPRTVPQPPATLVVEPSNGTASLVFEPPSDTGGDDLDAYLVDITPTGGGATVWSGTLNTLDTAAAVDGLTNGVSYTVTVKARNGAGASNPLTATVIPATTPGAPNNVRVRPGSIIVEWDAPADDGGDSVDHYEITVTDTDGISTTVETSGVATCSTSLRYCRITQVYTSTSPEALTTIPADMEYSIQVVAVNGQGSGDATLEVSMVASQPSEPVTVSATAGLESMAVCWAAPVSIPGSATISAYRLTFTVGAEVATLVVPAADLDPAPDCTSPSIGHRVTSFDGGATPVPGTTYTVQVAASVSVEDYVFGLQSSTVSATPYTFPSAPASVTTSAYAGDVTVAWTAGSGGGTTISGYTVTATPGGDTCTWTSGPLECTIPNVVDSTPYTFEVVATNEAGDGPARTSDVITVDAAAPVATWTSMQVVDDDTVQWRLDLNESISGLQLADFSTPTGSACTLALDAVGTASALVSLTCAPGAAVVRLAANALIDTGGNTGPMFELDTATVTFSAVGPPPDTTAPVATWTAVTVVDDDTVDLDLSFDEAVTDLSLADLSTPTGSACTLTLPQVSTDSARVRLRCSPGAAVVRLAAASVEDGAGNRGPATAVDGPTVTFSATAPPVSDPVVLPVPVEEAPLARLPFAGRSSVLGVSVDVAVALSRRRFTGGSGPVVHLALADRPVDIAAAGAAAVAAGGPLLLVRRTSLPTTIVEELRRLGSQQVVMVGGADAIGDEVLTGLRAVVGDGVVRVGGGDRYATAVAVSRATFSSGVDTVYVVSGRSTIDGLGVARFGRPVLLTDVSQVPAVTARELARLRPRRIVVVGGTAVVASPVLDQLAAAARMDVASVSRWAGVDRAVTAAHVASAERTSLRTAIVVNGSAPAGGLASATLLADPDTAVLLASGTCLPAATRAVLERWRPVQVLVVGSDPRLTTTVDEYRSC